MTLHEPTIADGILRPTHVEVDLSAISDNYAAIKARVGPARVMPILKANAYGHGLVAVAKHLSAAGAPILGVAYLEEGVHLRQAGVKTPILVLGGIVGRQIPLFLDHDLTMTASSLDKLAAIEACAQARGVRAKVHLKIDTGMERIGVHWYSAEPLLEASLTCKHVDVEGIFSHFANADGGSDDAKAATATQLARFREVLAFYDRRSAPHPVRHIANSGAILQHPDAFLDLVRPGILLYGVLPSDEVQSVAIPRALSSDEIPPITVRPALSWRAPVVFFKVIKAGNAASYGSSWAPTADTRAITLPVGYGDGYLRAMSGRAQVLVNGRRCPVVGRICMDQIMVDLSPTGTAYNGDEVVLIGRSGDGSIAVEDLARWANTVPHEILTSINTRVPRVYVGG